jgi:hypothetical protein
MTTRPRRGSRVHDTHDMRVTVCGLRCDGWIVEPDGPADCTKCVRSRNTKYVKEQP